MVKIARVSNVDNRKKQVKYDDRGARQCNCSDDKAATNALSVPSAAQAVRRTTRTSACLIFASLIWLARGTSRSICLRILQVKGARSTTGAEGVIAVARISGGRYFVRSSCAKSRVLYLYQGSTFR